MAKPFQFESMRETFLDVTTLILERLCYWKSFQVFITPLWGSIKYCMFWKEVLVQFCFMFKAFHDQYSNPIALNLPSLQRCSCMCINSTEKHTDEKNRNVFEKVNLLIMSVCNCKSVIEKYPSSNVNFAFIGTILNYSVYDEELHFYGRIRTQ